MKILHIISTLNPDAGGPSQTVKNFVSLYPGLGSSGEVLTLDPVGSPWSKLIDVPVYELGPGKTSFAYSFRLVSWLKKNASRFNAVIIHGLWQYPGYATWKALKNSSIPYYVFTHGMLDPWFKKTYPLKHLKKWLYWPWGQYPVLRDAKAVFFTCEEERVLARQSFWLYRCNEKVLGYGTKPSAGDTATQSALFMSTFPELANKRILLFLSRIHVKKGCDLLIKAFSTAIKRYPELQLVMAGPDQTGWKMELESLAQSLGVKDRITWTGMLTGDLKWGAFHTAEAFVLPSHQENFGIVVAESLACGTPVLISNKVNIWREVEADGAGLVEDDTLEGTQALLNRWMELDDSARAEMSNRARVCFTNRFEIERVARKLVDLIMAG